MTYTRISSDEIVLQLSQADFDKLMFLINLGVMRIREKEWSPERMYAALEFLNHLNNGNPQWIPYTMPLESYEPAPHSHRKTG